jgi:hypothetical protein
LIGAIDDAVIEPPHTGSVSHVASSADAFYHGASATLNANITDNDGSADLAISIPTPPPPLTVNQTFSVGFRDRNIGPTLSTGAVFTLPATTAFRFVSASGASCAPSGGSLACQLTGAPPGGQVNFTLTFRALQQGTFSFTMNLTGHQPDPNSANNTITRSVTVN